MTKKQMLAKMKKIEKELEELSAEAKAVDPTSKKATKWLVVSLSMYVAGITLLIFNPFAGLFTTLAALVAYSLHRSYDKEVTTYMMEISKRSEKLSREHLHLMVRSDPDKFVKSLLEGTLND